MQRLPLAIAPGSGHSPPMPEIASEYAYLNAEEGFHHLYLRPVVLDFLHRLGARTVLDLGCGNGSFARTLRAAGFAVAGCDASVSGIAEARAADPEGDYHVAGVEDDPLARFGERRFDAVLAIEVIEHLHAPAALAHFARPLLTKQGRLIVTTPYHGYWKNLALALVGKWDDHHMSYWDHGHVKFFSRHTLGIVMGGAGFEEQWFAGAGRLPYLWKSMVGCYRPKSLAP